jgi:hypothetical protein
MQALTPRRVRRLLVPASFLVFVAGLGASSVALYRAQPFDIKSAFISNLESPAENPRGYGVAAAATAISGILLAPAVVLFFRQTRKNHPRFALAGAVLFAVGLGATIAIGALAPFSLGYSRLHVHLAYVAFIGICSGTVCYLAAAQANRAFITLQVAALLVLLYLYFGPDFLSNDRLLTSLAFWEWMLCLNCGIGLWTLARTIEKKTAEKNRQNGTAVGA